MDGGDGPSERRNAVPRFVNVFAALALGVAAVTAAAAQPARTCCNSPGLTPSGPQAQEPEFKDLPKAGQKCWIGKVEYFVYEFDKTPKMGTVILKIQLFDKGGKQVADLDITGRSDMPSMRGAHDSGEVAFKLNKKGDYLLPVNVVMPGDWEVRLTFSRNKIVVFRGRVAFGV
jgi:hypothetical protein